MAKNTKQIGLMQQRSGKLNELPKQLAKSQFGFADDTNRLFIGNPEHPTLEERYKSNTFPYGNVEVLTEFSDNTNMIKYSPYMNGERIYQPLVIRGTTSNPSVKVGTSIKINDNEIKFGIEGAHLKNTDYDYLILKYVWEDGADLDINTKFTNIDNIEELNNVSIGYHLGQSIPTNKTISNSVAYWAGDNTRVATASNPQTESVLINRANLLKNEYYNDLPNNILMELQGCWFKTVGNQPVKITIEAYKNGTMLLNDSRTGFINVGGARASFTNDSGETVDSITYTISNIPETLHQYNIFGYLTFEKSLERTTFILTDENSQELPSEISVDEVANQINIMSNDVLARNNNGHIEIITIDNLVEIKDGENVDGHSALSDLGLTEGYYDTLPIEKRSLQDVLDDRYSIKSFGVQGNGNSSDGQLINNTFISVYGMETSDPKEIYFPADTYATDTSLLLMTNTHLIGEGIDRTIIKLKNSSKPLLVLADKNSVPSTDERYCSGTEYPHNILVEDMTFDVSETSAPELFYLNHCSNLEFKDCKFIVGNNDFVISPSNSNMKNIKFIDCVFEGNNTSLGKLQINGQLDGLLITNCEFNNIQNEVISLNGNENYIQNGIIGNNKFTNCGTLSRILVNANANTKYISLVKTLVDEDVLRQINDYQVLNTASSLNYCDTHYTTEDDRKFLRYNFYQSIYDFVTTLYDKYGHEALEIISKNANTEVTNSLKLNLGYGDNAGTLSLNATSQTGDVEIGTGKYGDLHLGKDSGEITNWSPLKPYNKLDVVRRNDNTYICIESHNASATFNTNYWKEIDGITPELWSPETEYNIDDIVVINDNVYVCVEAHTSGNDFDDRYWNFVESTLSYIKLHKHLDLNGYNIENTNGDIVFKTNGNAIVVDDENYEGAIADKPNALTSVSYVNDVINAGKRFKYNSEIIGNYVNDEDSSEISIINFDSTKFGDNIRLKSVSVNIRQPFIPISEQLMGVNPDCKYLDWTNALRTSEPNEYDGEDEDTEADIIRIYNPNTDEFEYYLCIVTHIESTSEPTDYANFLIGKNLGYWSQLQPEEAEGYTEYSPYLTNNVQWYVGDVVRVIYVNENGNYILSTHVDETSTTDAIIRFYICAKNHVTDSDVEPKEDFEEAIRNGYWKDILFDYSTITNYLDVSNYQYVRNNASATLTNYIGGAINVILPQITQGINTVPDLKYICIKSVDNSLDEPEEEKWLFDIDDIDAIVRDTHGYVYTSWQPNTTYTKGDKVYYNHSNFECIYEDEDEGTTYISGDSAIDVHNSDAWKKLSESGYDYQYHFERNLIVSDGMGGYKEEPYQFEHNFSNHTLQLCFYDENGEPLEVLNTDVNKFMTPKVYTVGDNYVKNDYITYNDTIYIVNISFTATDWEVDVDNCLNVNSLIWEENQEYISGQYIVDDNYMYYVLNSYVSSDSPEKDIEDGHLRRNPLRYLQVGECGEFLVTIGYERG